MLKGIPHWKKCILFLAALITAIYFFYKNSLEMPENKNQIEIKKCKFTESSQKLNNPNRGFYCMHGFVIRDMEVDYQEEITKRYHNDTGTTLTLVEINLKEYRDKEISVQGLMNIDHLFQSLKELDQDLILRILYDWDGKNLETEPDTRETIQIHMKQLEPVFRKYKEEIFVIQGLFVGDCGEMHHSKFLEEEDIKILAEQLAEVTNPNTFLAVRTPAYWRRITGISIPEQVRRSDGTLESRIGIFNDGMLGSSSDCGTYGEGTPENDGENAKWKRSEELKFLNTLCQTVPIGGEVIIDNIYNDLQNAVKDMSAMHVTYLNKEYDRQVLEKWADTVISEPGCFDGMDGLSYIDRHLGYRLVIKDAQLEYHSKEEILSVDVTLQNVGFAPVYKDTEVSISLLEKNKEELLTYNIPQDIRDLTGGMESAECMNLHTDVLFEELAEGEWEVFFEITDTDSGQRIYFGNEQYPEKYGYQIGSVERIVSEGRIN